MKHLHKKFHPIEFISFTLVFFFIATNVFFLKAQENITSKKNIVVLLHGLGRSKSSMWLLQSRFEHAGFLVKAVGYHSLDREPEQILRDVTKQINAFHIDSNQTVHFVGHSLGGLLIRAYLDSNTVQSLGRVVLIGSPSKGTPFVDHFHDEWWMKLAGPTANALGTDEKSFPKTLRPPYYPIGIIAGVSNIIDNEQFIPGEDDGVVPVESTKIEGMTDFVVIETSHSMMRYNESVAQQTIEFLTHGRFIKKEIQRK
jgi:hypothetical protein